MNNPFNLPDEVFTAIVGAVMKEQKNMKKSHIPENKFKIDPVSAAKKSATNAKQFYDAYVEVGFTNEQAFELTLTVLDCKGMKLWAK